ncbi:unnamed protein product [Tetraodon nigroviridis]|uniref:(spotted green pufferfish) hypothetical protein n=1 Tax=Tetraodon nigroviridis TaxID=99883 RepID=Q4RZS6_TETNG|nr:unnamed protein product [Tetraodon nigroviridis]
MTGRNLQRVVAVSFGLLCVLQALLNVSLRLILYNQAANQGNCCNSTTEERSILHKLDPYFQDGWILFQTSLYYISPEENTWGLSRDFCLQKDADLTVINSKAEQNFAGKFKRAVWIGLMEPENDSRFRWVDGTPLTESYWIQGEPNNYHGIEEDCVELVSEVGREGWNDLNCSSKNFFLCEKKII